MISKDAGNLVELSSHGAQGDKEFREGLYTEIPIFERDGMPAKHPVGIAAAYHTVPNGPAYDPG